MRNITVGGSHFTIEFRHVSKLGARRQLYNRAPMKAITTCVLIGYKSDGPASSFSSQPEPLSQHISFIATENSICANEDNFSRREGRLGALRKVLRHCGAVRPQAEAIWNEYMKTDPPAPARPVRDQDGNYYGVVETWQGNSRWLIQPPPMRPKLAAEEVAARKAAGAEKRLLRRQTRGGTA